MDKIIAVKSPGYTIEINQSNYPTHFIIHKKYTHHENGEYMALSKQECIELANALLAAAGERTIDVINMVHSADLGVKNSLAQMALDSDIQHENGAIYSEFKDTEMDGLEEEDDNGDTE